MAKIFSIILLIAGLVGVAQLECKAKNLKDYKHDGPPYRSVKPSIKEFEHDGPPYRKVKMDHYDGPPYRSVKPSIKEFEHDGPPYQGW